MNEDFIRINDAILNCNVCESTVRRWINKHKNNSNATYKKDEVLYLNAKLFYETYKPSISKENAKHEQHKELAEFTLEKQQLDLISQHQETINRLIVELSKPKKNSYLPLYITIGSLVLFLVLAFFAYQYRTELVNSFQSKIELIIQSKDAVIDAQKASIVEKSEAIHSQDMVILELRSKLNKMKTVENLRASASVDTGKLSL